MSIGSYRLAFQNWRKKYGASVLCVTFVTYAICQDQYNTWMYKTKIKDEKAIINAKVEELRQQLQKESKTAVPAES